MGSITNNEYAAGAPSRRRGPPSLSVTVTVGNHDDLSQLNAVPVPVLPVWASASDDSPAAHHGMMVTGFRTGIRGIVAARGLVTVV
jgi:hypothetical protein